MPNVATLGQRQYRFAIRGYLCFKFFDRDINFDDCILILHLLFLRPFGMKGRSQTPSFKLALPTPSVREKRIG